MIHTKIDNCLTQLGSQGRILISMYILKKEHFPFLRLVMKLEEMSAQKQCQAMHLKIPNMGMCSRQYSASLNPPIMQTRGRSGPHKWLRRFHIAHLPVCRGEPAVRSGDGWRPNRLGFHRILLEHACHPVSIRQQTVGVKSASLHAARDTNKPHWNHTGPHPTGTLASVCVA